MTRTFLFDGNAGAWRANAACRDADTELFFPGRGEDTKTPKAICATCTVRRECLDDALATGEHFGIRGGLSERQRRGLRRRPTRVAS